MYSQKISLILVIFTLFGFSGELYSEDISGPLSGEIGPGTYNVTGSISVLYGASLIIHPGTIFNFTGDFDFDIMGYIHANGNEIDSIIFRQESGDNWNGIDFISIAADSCIIEYSRVSGSNGVGFYINGSSPTISHCLISDNVAGEG
jgi:parallel beta-helix repeat protein